MHKWLVVGVELLLFPCHAVRVIQRICVATAAWPWAWLFGLADSVVLDARTRECVSARADYCQQEGSKPPKEVVAACVPLEQRSPPHCGSLDL